MSDHETRAASIRVLSTFDKTLPVKLTDEERASRAIELAQVAEALEALELAEAARRKDAKEAIAGLAAESKRLRRVVIRNEEPRAVPCEDVADFARGVVETIRLDTGDMVDSRDLRPDERQLEILG